MARLFIAQYHGRCPCGEPIEPGDEIGYVEDAISCANCVEFDDWSDDDWSQS